MIAAAELDVLGGVLPGTRYRLVDKLGEGGMGAVYVAEHPELRRRVALKLVRHEVLSDAEAMEGFRREAYVAARVGGPYTCEVMDWGDLPDGRTFFVMELIDGQTLGALLDRQRSLPAGRCIAILRQLAKALDAAHRQGIVHLDVKPENVLLFRNGNRADAVKLVDFGIADALGEWGCVSRLMGTPEYMAPERISSERYDHRADIYSLGALAYEMLTGVVPLEGENNLQTLELQLSGQPAALNERGVDPPVPAVLEALVMRMLEKDPDQRPDTMAEVEALLLEAQVDLALRTVWDDLPLPAMAPERALRIRRRLRPSAPRRLRSAARAALISLTFVAWMPMQHELARGLQESMAWRTR